VAGYGTQVLDLEGKVVVPGFIDSHVHFISGGLQVLYIQTHSLNDSMFFSFLWVLIILLKLALVYVRICFKHLRVIEIVVSV
jgi:hypothetical protein